MARAVLTGPGPVPILAGMSRWSDAKGADALVARLSGEGHSAREIASRVSNLGFAVTRNAVIGRISRLRILNSNNEEAPMQVTPTLPEPPPTPRGRPTGNEKRFSNIGPRECRFILGDVEGQRTMMCGNGVDPGDGAWCPYCRKVVYPPRTK